jgi:hypothetical protein
MPQTFDKLPFQIDHIIAEQHHGLTAQENLALACFACNHHKGPNIAGIDPVSGQTIRLFHPRNDRWNEHFAWQGPELVGLTPIGRATMDVLAINLDYRVALRRILLTLGEFPPRDMP